MFHCQHAGARHDLFVFFFGPLLCYKIHYLCYSIATIGQVWQKINLQIQVKIINNHDYMHVTKVRTDFRLYDGFFSLKVIAKLTKTK